MMCPVPNCHAGMLRDHNGRDSVSCPVCDGVLTAEDYKSLVARHGAPASAPPAPTPEAWNPPLGCERLTRDPAAPHSPEEPRREDDGGYTCPKCSTTRREDEATRDRCGHCGACLRCVRASRRSPASPASEESDPAVSLAQMVLKVVPCLEVRNWPPGWDLKKELLARARALVSGAGSKEDDRG